MQQITTRKVAHNHMIIKLMNIAYITKFLHIKKEYHASLGTKSHGARETFTNLYMASDAVHWLRPLIVQTGVVENINCPPLKMLYFRNMKIVLYVEIMKKVVSFLATDVASY